MNELFSPDHWPSGNGWADQLTAYLQRAKGPSRGLERAASEMCAFERSVHTSSGAALPPSFSLRDNSNLLLDTSNRWTAAASYGELLRVDTGTATFNVYLKDSDGSLPLGAIKEEACGPTKSMDPSTTNTEMTVNGQHGATGGVVEGEPATECQVVCAPSSGVGSESLVVIVCRAFVAILSSRLERPLEKRP
jgi:hypothetical protein